MTADASDDQQDHAGLRGRRAGLTSRFLLAVGQELGANDLTPAVLARAVVRVLPVDAAGFSTMSKLLRVPLGASDESAAWAEELQTSLGQGPCLDAARRRAPVALNADELDQRWPQYAAELKARTSFRSVAAVPLYAPGQGTFAALDLYAAQDRFGEGLDLVEAEQHVGRPAAAMVCACLGEVETGALDDRPGWYEAAAGRRHGVWVALGMVMNARCVSTPDALSLLRAKAYVQDRSLDDLAEDVVRGRVPTDLGQQK